MPLTPEELFAHLDGGLGLDETIERVRARSRQFAKRQLTWFRNMPELRPIAVTGDIPPDPSLFVALA